MSSDGAETPPTEGYEVARAVMARLSSATVMAPTMATPRMARKAPAPPATSTKLVISAG
jgi:hypothetical protein